MPLPIELSQQGISLSGAASLLESGHKLAKELASVQRAEIAAEKEIALAKIAAKVELFRTAISDASKNEEEFLDKSFALINALKDEGHIEASIAAFAFFVNAPRVSILETLKSM